LGGEIKDVDRVRINNNYDDITYIEKTCRILELLIMIQDYVLPDPFEFFFKLRVMINCRTILIREQLPTVSDPEELYVIIVSLLNHGRTAISSSWNVNRGEAMTRNQIISFEDSEMHVC